MTSNEQIEGALRHIVYVTKPYLIGVMLSLSVLAFAGSLLWALAH